jgi:hypothetical protein
MYSMTLRKRTRFETDFYKIKTIPNDDPNDALGGPVTRHCRGYAFHEQSSRWCNWRLSRWAYALSRRLSGVRIIVPSCDSSVRIHGRIQNAPVTRVPVGMWRYVIVSSNLKVDNCWRLEVTSPL